MAKPVHRKTKGITAIAAADQSHAFLGNEDRLPLQAGNLRQGLTCAFPKYGMDTTLASLIDSSRSTVWRYVQQGILPQPIKIGGLTRFDLEHALLCIRAGKVVPPPHDGS